MSIAYKMAGKGSGAGIALLIIFLQGLLDIFTVKLQSENDHHHIYQHLTARSHLAPDLSTSHNPKSYCITFTNISQPKVMQLCFYQHLTAQSHAALHLSTS